MYEKFFELRRNPFMLVADPHFLYLTPHHREALTGLAYSISQRKGFAVVTGDAGTGKTTMLRTLVGSLGNDICRFSLLVNPTLTRVEFLEMVLLDFGITDLPAGKARQLERLNNFLRQRHERGLLTSILVDEAHMLSLELLEEIRLLTNFENLHGKLLQIVLAGQMELDEILDRTNLRQLKQRIACRLRVRPLQASQIEPYLRYRWSQAGGASNLPFSEDCIDYLALFSGCIPRVLNAICDGALLIAFVEGTHEVRPEHIVEVAKDLALHKGELASQCNSEPETDLAGAMTPDDLRKFIRSSCLPTSDLRPSPAYGAKQVSGQN